MKKYLAFIKIGAKEESQSFSGFVIRLCFYILVIFVYAKMWDTIGKDNVIGLSARDFIWYLSIGELFYFSRPREISLQIEEEVRSGSIAYTLTKPISYLASKMLRYMTAAFVRIPILTLFGLIVTYLITKELPSTFSALPIIFGLSILSLIAWAMVDITIGTCALWMHDTTPIQWLVQKLDFILGGLMIPLTVFPIWYQEIAYKAPFAWMNFGVARLIYEYTPERAFETLHHLIIWNTIIAVLMIASFSKLSKNVSVSGG